MKFRLGLAFCFSIVLNTQQVLGQQNELASDGELVDSLAADSIVIFEPNRFVDNLYLTAFGGTQLLFSSDVTNLNFGERFSTSFLLGIGNWSSPYWGMNFQMQGGSLNGFSTTEGSYLADKNDNGTYGNNDPVRQYATIRPDGSYRHYVRYVNTSLAVQFSAINVLFGYKENRKWDIIPAAGVGWMQVVNYEGIPATASVSLNAQLQAKYKVSNKFDLNLQVTGALLPDQFEGRIVTNSYEGYMSANIGVSYFFKRKGFKKINKTTTTEEVDIVVDTVYQIVHKTDTVFVEKEAPVVVVQNVASDIKIKFDERSLKVTDTTESDKLVDLAAVLKNNPEVKIRIIGHTCDRASDAVNKKLGKERALVVKQKLLDLGVSNDQVLVESKSFEEPIAPNTSEENRAKNRRVEIKMVY